MKLNDIETGMYSDFRTNDGSITIYKRSRVQLISQICRQADMRFDSNMHMHRDN